MKTISLALFLLVTLFPARAQEIKILDFAGLKPLLETRNDTTYIINFWATWCIPCVKEIPYFQQIHDKYQHQPVRVVLVSLDFVKHMDTRLKPFIEKNNLTPDVILLNDPDANAWIDQVNPEWSGALPASLIYNRNFSAFYEKSFTFEELDQIINHNIIKP